MNLLNTVLGVSIVFTAVFAPCTLWMLRGCVAEVPAELEDAAIVDGPSRKHDFTSITLPLLAPRLVTSRVYAFLQSTAEPTLPI